MTRVRIRGGYLTIGRRQRPGHPDQGLPGVDEPTDPDYGVDDGSDPGVDNELPAPPPGIWPPLTPEQPWRPIDPGFGHGRPERPSTGPVVPGKPVDPDYGVPDLPPGSIWPPLPPSVHGKYLALVLIGGGGHGAHYRYVVIDADALPPKPDHELPPRPQPKA
jgi:hypothetical protein